VTAVSLRQIVAQELARIGLEAASRAPERARSTDFIAALPGFGVRSYPSGRRVYIVQRRIGGRMRTVTIGNAAVMTEAVARDVASRVLLRCQVGENPADTRAMVRSAPTFPAFLDEYWQRMSRQWKPRTIETHDGYRRLHLDDAFAGRFVDQIETADVARWLARLTDRSGPGAANRCLSILNAMMRKAEDWGYRPEGSNPCAGVKANRRRQCERFLSDQELARLGKVLRDAEATHPVYTAAVTMILLTGCRKSEILALRWSEVKGKRLLLTESKTGARTIWLGIEARSILSRFERQKPADRVFRLDGDSRNALDGFWRLIRHRAGIADVRLHDLRHSFASFAARRAETLPMIGKLLGHAKIASTARYTHLDDSDVIVAAEHMGSLIVQLSSSSQAYKHSSQRLSP
jgi:integrase